MRIFKLLKHESMKLFKTSSVETDEECQQF